MLARANAGLQAAGQKLGGAHGAFISVVMRAKPVADQPVGQRAHLLGQGGVQVIDPENREIFGARNGADALQEFAVHVFQLRGDHGAMQRQEDAVQFVRAAPQHRLHVLPEAFEHIMPDHARGAAQVIGGGDHLPAQAFGGSQEAVHLRAVADTVQQVLAAMDHEVAQGGAVVGEAVGFVEDARQQDFGHAGPLCYCYARAGLFRTP